MRMSITKCGSITQHTSRVQPRDSSSPDPRVAFFNHHAPTWDDNPDEVADHLKRLEELRERIGFAPGQSVLEVGCGTGRITGWIAGAVRPGRVVAVDFSPAMLTQARARGIQAEFRLMDICADVSTEERFDIVLCFHSFPHFRDQLRALRNMRSLLNDGGQLIILHLAGSAKLNEFHSQLAHPVCHDHLPPADKWPDVLAGAGLRLASFTDEPGLFLLKATPTPDAP